MALYFTNFSYSFFSPGATSRTGSGPPRYRGFTMAHTTLGRDPLDEWSARRTYPYRTTHNRHPCPSRNRTRNPSQPATADLSLRPRGHWDRWIANIGKQIYSFGGIITGLLLSCRSFDTVLRSPVDPVQSVNTACLFMYISTVLRNSVGNWWSYQVFSRVSSTFRRKHTTT